MLRTRLGDADENIADTDQGLWRKTKLKDDARDKAISSHDTMGLVSALLAGFELQALVEVDTCQTDEECSGAEGAFVICASYCVGLSMIVVLETAFEYMFVMRELHHGPASAWMLIRAFRPFRRLAEFTFALEIVMFLISTGTPPHVSRCRHTARSRCVDAERVMIAMPHT